MKRGTVLPAILSALVLIHSSPAFCKGKKPPPAEEEQQEESQIQEDMLSPEEVPEKSSPNGSFQPDEEVPAPESRPETPQKFLPPQAVAEEQMDVPPGASVHTVWIWQETRDCLWKLAKIYYNDPWQWKKIYLQNRSRILNPNVIFPKQRLVIPPAEQEPQEQKSE